MKNAGAVKTCISCNKSMNLDKFFYKSKASADGRAYYCIPCTKVKQEMYRKSERARLREKEYYKKNIGKITKYAKEYYKENMDVIKAYKRKNTEKIKKYKKEHSKTYVKENADKLKESRKAYVKKNPEKIKEYNRKWRAKKSDLTLPSK